MTVAFEDVKKEYGADVTKLLVELRESKSEKQLRDAVHDFMEHSWRSKGFIATSSGASEASLKESRKGRISINEPAYQASQHMARVLSEMNDRLRNEISEGRKKAGMGSMTADGYE